MCTAFNADFDGDQMAVHLPLSAEAQAESRVLMLSANNILSPANGRPIITPSKDMVLGAYYLTLRTPTDKERLRVFRHVHEVERAYEAGEIALHEEIEVRIPALRRSPVSGDGADGNGAATYEATTAGRLLFNQALPADFGYVNDVVGKNTNIATIVEKLSVGYSKAVVAECVDEIKNLAFRYATQSGLTFSIDDVRTPAAKRASSTATSVRRRRSRRSSGGASSPTVSAARRRWRSGPTPPPRWKRPCARAWRPTPSTPSR